MVVEGMQFPWRSYGGTISPNLGVIWKMSAIRARPSLRNSGATTAGPMILVTGGGGFIGSNLFFWALNKPAQSGAKPGGEKTSAP